MRKTFQFCALVLAQMLLLPPLHAQTRDISVHGELLDRIAAVVNDGLVLKSELDEQMSSVQKRLQEQRSSCLLRVRCSSRYSIVWCCRKFNCSAPSTSVSRLPMNN